MLNKDNYSLSVSKEKIMGYAEISCLVGMNEYMYMYIIIMPKQLSKFKRENGHQCTKFVTK